MIRRIGDAAHGGHSRRAKELDAALDAIAQDVAFVHQGEFAAELTAAQSLRRSALAPPPPAGALTALQEALAARPAVVGGRARSLRVAAEVSAAVAAAAVALAGFQLVDTGGAPATTGTTAARALQAVHDRIALISSRVAAGDVSGVGSTAEEVRMAILQTEDAISQLPADDPQHQALLSRLDLDITELNGLVDRLHLDLTPLVPLAAAPSVALEGPAPRRAAVSEGMAACRPGGSAQGQSSASPNSTTSTTGSTGSTTSTSAGSGTSTTSTTATTAAGPLTRTPGYGSASSSTSSSTSSTATTPSTTGGSAAGQGGAAGC